MFPDLDLLQQPLVFFDSITAAEVLAGITAQGKPLYPPQGYRWLIIGGAVHHITGTGSILSIKDAGSFGGVNLSSIDTAEATADYPFPAQSSRLNVISSMPQGLWIMSNSMRFLFTGGTGILFSFYALEYPEKKRLF